ncbi:inositol monophosphatase family protein [Benzoatithermus flavus]|uniref:Inositol-1-monophosphatase n=1 Tax=Benzoatithermus flavus TaxID=3108223 RepID=A0ABU8XKH7_9PROT
MMDPQELDARLEAAIPAVRAAGRLALEHFLNRDRLAIEHKGQQDLVSIADRAVEDLLRRELNALFPEDAILGEEGGGEDAPRSWVLDPIDGTFNFLKGIPCWGVVAAYVVDGRTLIGITYDPVHDELFTARRGGGAFRNGTPIRVSGNTSVDTSCLALAYSFRQPKETYVGLVKQALDQGFEHRRMGSTAIQLCWVADGRCDGIATLLCSSWDVLAGLILVEEAGGRATDFLGAYGLLGKGGIIACTPALAPELEAVSGLVLPR